MSRFQRIVLLFLCLFLLNCTTAQPAPDRLPALSGGLSMRVLRGDGRNTPYTTSQKLPLSEPVTIEFSVSTPSYVYVVLYSPAGESTQLFPGKDRPETVERLLPGQIKRISFVHPESTMQDAAPDLRIFGVASESPLGPALCTLLRLRCDKTEQKSRSRGADDPPPTPPPHPREPDTDRRPGSRTKGKGPEESLGPNCVTVMIAAESGVHELVGVVPIVLNYQALSAN